MHYVQTAISVGNNSGPNTRFDLNPGDLLLTMDTGNGSVTLNSGTPQQFIADRMDIVVFRPTAAGNYASGQYFMLLNDGVKDAGGSYNVHALTLIETATTVGGTLLPAGTFVIAHSTPAVHNNIYTFTATSTGTTNTVTANVVLLLDGNALGLAPGGDKVFGLHVLTAPTAFNDSVLAAGTVLVAIDGGTHVYGGVTEDAGDIVALTVTGTGASTAATGQLLFDGSDLPTSGLASGLNGFTVVTGTVSNSVPVANTPIANQSTNEDVPFSLAIPAGSFTDADAADVLVYSARLASGGVLPPWLAFDATTRTFSGTPANGDVGAITIRVTATDPQAAYATSDFTLSVVNVNDAPVLTGANDLGSIAEDPASNPGTLVSALISGKVSDVDVGAVTGIALVGADNGNGAWQYTTNGGALWRAVGTVTDASARLLAADASTLVRFVPNANWNGTAALTLRAWNRTSGSAGGIANIVTAGGISAFSSATAVSRIVVTPVQDAPTGAPTITGTTTEDQTLGVDTTSIADVDGLGTFGYQWLRNGASIAGATSATLLLGDADVGKLISVRVSYVDGGGTAEALTSVSTAAVVNINDVPTGAPTITGSAIENQTLTAKTSTIADADGLGSFSYQWLRNGGSIAGATASTLVLGNADVGSSISVRVSYVDGQGTAEALTSGTTAAVVNVNDAPTGLPVMSGTALEDQTLSVDASAVADLDGLGSFNYQWLRNGAAISGATGTSLVLGDADVGKAIRVRVSFVDGHGTAESVTSAATVAVLNINDAPTGLPTIGGSAIEDRTLTANVSAIADDDGVGSFSYQWLRNGSVIGGATASTLLLGDADVGKSISLRVSYTDAHGTAEALTSAPTAAVANVNDAPRGSNATLTVDRNGSRTLQRTDFGFADTGGESNAFSSVLLQVPSAGSLRLAGSQVSAPTEVTVAQLDAGLLVYSPVFSGSGSSYASIGFQVRDDGGTANGGIDLDPVRRSLSIDIVNHAPVISSHAGAPNVAVDVFENTSVVTSVSATDPDADTLSYSIVGGSDATRFKVDSATGALSFVVPPNFEAPLDTGADNVYQIIVRASDGLQGANQTFAVTVGNVSEALQNTVELPVNSVTADLQETAMVNRGSDHAVAIAPNGDHVVVWSSRSQDGAGWGVYGQRFDQAGAALGNAFLVNQTTAGDQIWATVAMDVSGRSVISWTSSNQDGTAYSVYARRYNADGSANGGEFRANSTGSGSQYNSTVAIDGNGNFIIVWEGNGPGDTNGIFARRFGADGTAIDAIEFLINADTSRAQHDAGVSMNAAGAFAVTWDNSEGVQIRRYNSSGLPISGQIKVTEESSAGDGSIALAEDGSIVVVWRETQVGRAVVMQRFSGTGAMLGGNSVVNSTFSSDQTNPSIAMDGQGNFIVAWEGNGVGDSNGVFAQKFNASGSRVGGEFRLNMTTSGAQAKVSLAMLDLDNLVAVWSGQGATDAQGVFMRQYGTLNSAPVLVGANALATITEDQAVNNGTLVSSLIAGKLSDVDNPGTFGIAVIGVDNSHGSWQYTINGGSNWTAFGAVDSSTARLLAADSTSSVRFVADPDWFGTVAGGLQMLGWDMHSGVAGGIGNATLRGGTTAFSDATAASSIIVTPVNDLPVGLPRIVGSAIEDQTLLADLTGISDVDGLGAFNLQWLRNGVAIGGATGSSLLLGDADVGKTIRLRVSYVDAQGTSELLTSPTTAAVANVNDLPLGLPVIVGQAIEDRTLVADLTGISDADGLGSFSLQWQRGGVAISGATGSSLILGDADVGKVINLRVSYVDGYGTSESLIGMPTAPVGNVNDAPLGRPAIVGAAQEDRTLTADLSNLRDADGLGPFALQWLRDGVAINGATASSLTLGDADVGRTISLRVRYVDGHGTAEQLTSAATGPVANVNDAPTGRPVIVGTPIEHQTLSADLSGIGDADGLGSFQLQWLRNGVAITGATGNDLLLGELDDGQLISLRVSYVDGFGQAEVIESLSTPPIVAVNDAPFVNLPLGDRRAIVGSNFELLIPINSVVDPDIGDTLTWTVRPGNGSSALPGWLNFDSSTGRFYGVPARGDLGLSTIRLTATDSAGISVSDEFALQVVLTNQAPVAAALSDQSASQGTPFNYAVPAGTFSDVDLGDVLDVQARLVTGGVLPAWLVFDPAAQRFSGIPANADVGDLRIRVTATDLAGVSASSDFALRVANVNDAPIGRAIADQRVDQDGSFSLDVGTHFVDIDVGDQLRLDAKLSSGAALPTWLKFDAATGLMVGIPSNGDVGRLDIRVTATDRQGASTGLDFKLTVANVNDAPRLIGALENRRATDGTAFSATISAGRFVDIDAGDTLTFSVELASGSDLPDWLVFDPDSLNFRGTPGNADIGSLSIRITATDATGASASGTFRLTVDNRNDEPTLEMALPDQLATQDQPFAWTLLAGHFNDVDVDDVLSYRATLTSGAALPAWLSFDPATQRFSGTPGNGDVGELRVRITASDLDGASAFGDFGLRVADVNDAPRLVGTLEDVRATDGSAFSAAIPPNQFIDIDAGDHLVFSAQLASGSALPTWLTFDSDRMSLLGTPGNADIGLLSIRITATDAAGASVSGTFRLTVDNRNDAPALDPPLPGQLATQDQPFNWTLPGGHFSDADLDDVLSYRATLASGAALPAWLSFDPGTLSLSGTPGNADVGGLQIRITASDVAGTSAFGDFGLRVADVNDAPHLSGAHDLISIQESQFNNPGTLVANLIRGMVTDIDTNAVTGIAVVAVDASHGTWQFSTDGRAWTDFGLVGEQSARLLAADATTAVRFVPVDRWRGDVSGGLTLRAWDQSSGVAGQLADAGNRNSHSAFSSETALVGINVSAVNHAPELVLPFIDRSAVEAQAIEWRLPAASFVDGDADDVLTYSATLTSGAPLPGWLKFDPTTLTFKGSPQFADIGSMTIRVTAIDAAGAGAQGIFTIKVAQAPSLGAAAPIETIPEIATAERGKAPVQASVSAGNAPGVLLIDVLDQAAGRSGRADGVLATATPIVVESDIKPVLIDLVEPARPASRDDAVLATLPSLQFSNLTLNQAAQWLQSDEMLRKFDDLKHQMQDLGEQQQQIVASSLAISSGLSIGYVVWLVRGGVLVSSMLSALPAWQMIDPMPVLAAAGAARGGRARKGWLHKDAEGDDHAVEQLFDGQSKQQMKNSAHSAHLASGISQHAGSAVHPSIQAQAQTVAATPPGHKS
ncbi:MAG: putative Ig domain-containing protein [Ideonella sp.]